MLGCLQRTATGNRRSSGNQRRFAFGLSGWETGKPEVVLCNQAWTTMWELPRVRYEVGKPWWVLSAGPNPVGFGGGPFSYPLLMVSKALTFSF